MTTRQPRLHPRTHLGMCFAATALTFASVAMAPSAAADANDTVKAAVAAARSSSCPALRPVPVIDEVARGINKTTDGYINHTVRAVPETDAVPILKDLGYPANKAYILSGSAHTAGDSIKAALLQGFDKLPDCSYADFGVDTMYNAKKDVVLVTVVLAA